MLEGFIMPNNEFTYLVVDSYDSKHRITIRKWEDKYLLAFELAGGLSIEASKNIDELFDRIERLHLMIKSKEVN